MLDETFEIKLRNHKKEPVDVRVVAGEERPAGVGARAPTSRRERRGSRSRWFMRAAPPRIENRASSFSYQRIATGEDGKHGKTDRRGQD